MRFLLCTRPQKEGWYNGPMRRNEPYIVAVLIIFVVMAAPHFVQFVIGPVKNVVLNSVQVAAAFQMGNTIIDR